MVLSLQAFAKMTIFLNFAVPFATFTLIFKTDVESSPGVAVCVGEAHRNFFSHKYLVCDYDDKYAKYACRFWSYSLLLLMANIFDIIFIILSAKAIKEQTESSKHMLSNKEYINRRRQVFYLQILIRILFNYVYSYTQSVFFTSFFQR